MCKVIIRTCSINPRKDVANYFNDAVKTMKLMSKYTHVIHIAVKALYYMSIVLAIKLYILCH